MDPQVAWKELQFAYRERDWDEVRELAQSLLDWLQRGGFPPTVLGKPFSDPEQHREVARAFCRRALRKVAEYS